MPEWMIWILWKKFTFLSIFLSLINLALWTNLYLLKRYICGKWPIGKDYKVHLCGLIDVLSRILCLWFRASLIYINNCTTRCNTKLSIYYSASSVYMFLVSTTRIIGSTQNCNCSLRYWSYFLCSYLLPTWPSLATLEGGSCTKNMKNTGGSSYSFVYSGVVYTRNIEEWTCRIINRQLCVAPRWTVINIVLSRVY